MSVHLELCGALDVSVKELPAQIMHCLGSYVCYDRDHAEPAHREKRNDLVVVS